MGIGSRVCLGLCASVLMALADTPAAFAQRGPAPTPGAPNLAPETLPAGKTATPEAAAADASTATSAPRKPRNSKASRSGKALLAKDKAPIASPGPSHAKTPAPTKKPPVAPRRAAPREHPAARLPSSEPGKPDENARRALSGRRPNSSQADPRESVELLRIRELDRTLFPQTNGGARAPWPDDIGGASVAPKVDDSGLPPATPTTPIPPQTEPTPPDLTWLGALEKPDMPVRFDPAVVRYLTYYRDNPRGRSTLAAWVKRSGRYGTAIRKVLRDRGLPEDLVWLALVESGFDATIHSHAGAAGLWQFVPSTGRVYGLTVTRRVDERLDPERATHAAIQHLDDLHTRFGSWELAFAAYNMGYGGLLAAIRKFNTNDYWELRQLEAGLPYETALYAPKIFSIAIAARNCKVFGCDGIELDPPEPFGDIAVDKVSVAPGVSLQELSSAIGTRPATLEALNPHLLGSRLPPFENVAGSRETWTVYVPRGKGALAKRVVPKDVPPRQLTTYRVRWGEPTEHIAARFGTGSSHIEKLNDLSPGESTRPGATLFVPAHVRPRPDADAAADVAGTHGLGKTGKPIVVIPGDDVAYPDRRRMIYQAVLGDSTEDVADACGVTAWDLRRWNHMDSRAALQDGMTLQVFLPKDAHPRDVLLLDAAQLEPMPVASSAFFNHFIGQLGRDRLEVVARPGDTWAALAGRHGMSVGMLERINQKSRSSKVEPGTKVVVYERRRVVAPTPAAAESEDLDVDVDDDDDDDSTETAAGPANGSDSPTTRPPATEARSPSGG